MIKRFTLAAASAVLLSGAAHADQISLAPSNVIGSSGAYSSGFLADNILDNQSGDISDQFGSNYWINPDNGPANAWITVDLGAQYRIGHIDLFNTHNDFYNDRGTGDFSILAGNSVTDVGGGNYDLTGTTTTLISGTLLAQSDQNEPLDAQGYLVTDTATYRYLSFRPHSVSTSGSPCCGANVYGLNEMRVFSAPPVPEPSTYAMLAAGLAGLGLVRSRRKR